MAEHQHDETNDPQWVTVEIDPGDATLVVAHNDGKIRVGVGGFACNCCGEPSLMLAIVAAGESWNVRMEPQQMLEIAGHMMAALDRVGTITKSGAN